MLLGNSCLSVALETRMYTIYLKPENVLVLFISFILRENSYEV
jgi:hypothetical protein